MMEGAKVTGPKEREQRAVCPRGCAQKEGSSNSSRPGALCTTRNILSSRPAQRGYGTKHAPQGHGVKLCKSYFESVLHHINTALCKLQLSLLHCVSCHRRDDVKLALSSARG